VNSAATDNTSDIKTAATFAALPLSADVRRAIDELGFVNPTPVQLAVFEPASRGKSLVVQARTGTGKTAAFGLPIIDTLVRKGVEGVQALVLTPTRELALQVARELSAIAQYRGTQVTAIYGGAPMGRQVEALAGGTQVVVGTPGRVLDHLRRGTLDPKNVRIFVLDEADEMLSMGFAKELHAIVETLPKDRQGLFFSATIPPDIERMATAQMKDPEFVTLSSDSVGAQQITHYVYFASANKRSDVIKVIEVEDPESAVVFCNTKDETERLAAALQDRGYDAEWLNGDLPQNDRERVMAKTREGKLRFLVATDVAARGIDISHLTHVINADFPESAEQYVHRTGRTGRAGRTGTAISIVGPKDIGALYILRLTYKIRPVEKRIPSATELKTRAEADVVTMFLEAFGKSNPHPDDLALARRLLTHENSESIIAGLLRAHLGAREASGEKPAQEAAEARRAKNPAPITSARMSTPEPKIAPIAGRVVAPVVSQVTASRESIEPSAPTQRHDAIAMSTRGDDDRALTMRVEKGPPSRRDDDRGRRGRKPRGENRSSGFSSVEPRTSVDALDMPDLPGFQESTAPTTDRHDTDPPTPQPMPRAKPAQDSEEGFSQLFVNVGKRDSARESDLIKLLREGGLGETDVGRVRMRDRNCFVSVRTELVETAVNALAGKSIAGRIVVAELARPR
jgi:ATP-dependent RNA helicase DeaD